MNARKLAVAAIGAAMLGLGPAATLAVPEPARADPTPCETGCHLQYYADKMECARRMPPLPTLDDEFAYDMCVAEAGVELMDCNASCTD